MMIRLKWRRRFSDAYAFSVWYIYINKLDLVPQFNCHNILSNNVSYIRMTSQFICLLMTVKSKFFTTAKFYFFKISLRHLNLRHLFFDVEVLQQLNLKNHNNAYFFVTFKIKNVDKQGSVLWSLLVWFDLIQNWMVTYETKKNLKGQEIVDVTYPYLH